MNRYSGAIGAVAVAALFVLPASSVNATPASPAGTTTSVERPCFIVRPNWNTALDGPQPVCTTRVNLP